MIAKGPTRSPIRLRVHCVFYSDCEGGVSALHLWIGSAHKRYHTKKKMKFNFYNTALASVLLVSEFVVSDGFTVSTSHVSVNRRSLSLKEKPFLEDSNMDVVSNGVNEYTAREKEITEAIEKMSPGEILEDIKSRIISSSLPNRGKLCNLLFTKPCICSLYLLFLL